MKKATVILCICLAIILCLTACQNPDEYIPRGEFYAKTSPANGDAGVSEVLSLEADKVSYAKDGALTVPMTVGFGHHPDQAYEDDKDTFYVQYQIVEDRWSTDVPPVWEKKVEYTDSWHDKKYNSTEPENHSFLFIPLYGDFYPLYKETVEIVFPADVDQGYLQVRVHIMNEEHNVYNSFGVDVYFECVDGVMTLEEMEF